MDSQEEYLFCKSKKKVCVQFKRRQPRQSLWFAMKELYSIFTGFVVSVWYHFLSITDDLYISSVLVALFFCIVCLQWMNCTACSWFSWILLFLFGKSFSFCFYLIFLKRVFYCCFWFCTEVRVYSAILWNSDMSNERHGGRGRRYCPAPFYWHESKMHLK